MDGTGPVETILDRASEGPLHIGRPIGIDLDLVAGKIYYTDMSGVRRLNLNGSNHENVAGHEDEGPRRKWSWKWTTDVTVDAHNGYVYWVNDSHPAYNKPHVKLQRGSLEGSDEITVLWSEKKHLGKPSSVTLIKE